MKFRLGHGRSGNKDGKYRHERIFRRTVDCCVKVTAIRGKEIDRWGFALSLCGETMLYLQRTDSLLFAPFPRYRAPPFVVLQHHHLLFLLFLPLRALHLSHASLSILLLSLCYSHWNKVSSFLLLQLIYLSFLFVHSVALLSHPLRFPCVVIV